MFAQFSLSLFGMFLISAHLLEWSQCDEFMRTVVLCSRAFLQGGRNVHVAMAHLYVSHKSELWLKPTFVTLKKRMDLLIVDIFSE